MDAQVVVNGILLGGIYAIVGAGFSLVWGVLNIINIAHGASVMLGAYVTYVLFARVGLDPFVTIPFSMAALFALGYALQWTLINRILRHGVFMTLVLTFGLSLFLVDLALLIFSADYRSVTPVYSGKGLEVFGVIFPYQRLAILFIGLFLIMALHIFLNQTRLGRAIRATALNRDAAELCGVDIRRIYAFTFGIGASLAGAAGSMLAMVMTISPFLGNAFVGKSFVIATLGGLGTVQGALVGGVLLALAESLGGALVGPSFQHALGFAILLGVLIFRPEGVLGKKYFAEVK